MKLLRKLKNKIKFFINMKIERFDKKIEIATIEEQVKEYIDTKFPANFALEFNLDKYNDARLALIEKISSSIRHNIEFNKCKVKDAIELFSEEIISEIYSIDSFYIQCNPKINKIYTQETKTDIMKYLEHYIPNADDEILNKISLLVVSMMINGIDGEYDSVIDFYIYDLKSIYNTYEYEKSMKYYRFVNAY